MEANDCCSCTVEWETMDMRETKWLLFAVVYTSRRKCWDPN